MNLPPPGREKEKPSAMQVEDEGAGFMALMAQQQSGT